MPHFFDAFAPINAPDSFFVGRRARSEYVDESDSGHGDYDRGEESGEPILPIAGWGRGESEMLEMLEGVAEGDAHGADVGNRLLDGAGGWPGGGRDETVVEVADGVEAGGCCLERDVLYGVSIGQHEWRGLWEGATVRVWRGSFGSSGQCQLNGWHHRPREGSSGLV